MPKNHPDYRIFSLKDFKEFVAESHFCRVVTTLVNEHSAPFRYQHFDPKFRMQLLLDIDMYHRQYGYSSMCYHVVVFPDGSVGYCRPIDAIPGGFVKDNSADIVICALGDFNEMGDVMTSEQQNAVVEVNATFCKKFGIKPSTDSVTLACWYNLATGERDGGGDPALHKASPGRFFFKGPSVADVEDEFLKLVRIRTKTNKMAEEHIISGKGLFTAVVTSDSLRIRNLPAADGETLAFIERGTKVRVYEEDDRWYRVHPHEHLWVSGRFADPTAE